jgi:hypothetical protein
METLPSVTGIGHYGDRVDSTRCLHVSHHSLVQTTHLILIVIFLSNLSSSTYYLSHIIFVTWRKLVVSFTSQLDAQDTLISKPYGSYRSGFTISRRPPRKPSTFLTASPSIREEIPSISHAKKPSACILYRKSPLRRPAKSALKRLILTTTPLCQHYLLKMSMVPGIIELTDTECKSGQVTPRPPSRTRSPRLAC